MIVEHDPERLLGPDGRLPEARPPWPARDKLRITAVRPVVVNVERNEPAFGLQKSHEYHEAFPGCPVVTVGHMQPSDGPGRGVDLDGAAARRHPPTKFLFERWAAVVRRPDGALEAP